MDDVFLRLMASSGVPAEAREATLAQLHALQARHPGETPARLFARARREGGAIPPSRCPHGVVHGDCVACDPKLGERFYFTVAGALVHTHPTCEQLTAERPAAVEAARDRDAAGLADGRDLCTACPTPRAARTPRAATARRSTTRPPVRRPSAPSPGAGRQAAPAPQGPKPLDAAAPPSVGEVVDWGGFTGTVTGVSERGVALDVGGVVLTAPWGDRARVRRPQ